MTHERARREPSAGLDRRTLNRTLLARQGLLARHEAGVEATIERLVGMQAQVPRDPYIGLWSRLREFDPMALEAAFLERRVVRMPGLRTTLHLVTAADALEIRLAMQPVIERAFASSHFRRQLSGLDLAAVRRAGTDLLEEAPMTIASLGARLHERWPDAEPQALGYAIRYLVPIVQVPPRGLWTASGAARITTLQAWLGSEAPPVATDDRVAGAVDAAILRYLRSFGPSTIADIRAWSWLTNLRAAVERLGPKLRRLRDDRGRTLLDVADGQLEDGSEPAPVRFLGEYDNVFLSHADRTRITGDIAWGNDYVRRGATFADGFLLGPWRLVPAAAGTAVLEVEPRRTIGAGMRSEVELEGERLLAFVAPDATGREIRWRD
ncbi:MAG TPA: winged helix DNA-binding domain-containing protein [Candidatus Limnocylindrales bacterium]|nr:winged helix DNA-binding domain-containing protein [Candidatus Limnocylindrales bacterium]